MLALPCMLFSRLPHSTVAKNINLRVGLSILSWSNSILFSQTGIFQGFSFYMEQWLLGVNEPKKMENMGARSAAKPTIVHNTENKAFLGIP
jgi:hypothetical protein